MVIRDVFAEHVVEEVTVTAWLTGLYV